MPYTAMMQFGAEAMYLGIRPVILGNPIPYAIGARIAPDYPGRPVLSSCPDVLRPRSDHHALGDDLPAINPVTRGRRLHDPGDGSHVAARYGLQRERVLCSPDSSEPKKNRAVMEKTLGRESRPGSRQGRLRQHPRAVLDTDERGA